MLDTLKRRLLNFGLLEYTPGELWEWLRLRTRLSSPLPSHPLATLVELPEDPDTQPDASKVFEHIIVISLAFRHDRRQQITQRLREVNLDFTFFDAIHGQTVPDGEIEPFFAPITRRYLPKGSIGCALSHAEVWRQMLNNGWETCLILEDDVLLTYTFVKELARVFREVPPNFDLVYLGSGTMGTADIRQFVSPHVFIPFYPREGLYGYVLSAAGARRLLHAVFPIRLANGGIDTIVGKLVRKRQLWAYHLWPALCTADLISPSNIPNPGGTPKPLDPRELLKK